MVSGYSTELFEQNARIYPETLKRIFHLSIKVQSNSPPSAQREHAVAQSESFPVHTLLQRQEPVAMTAVAVEPEVEVG